MRIRSFTLSMVPRCKFLLLAAIVFILGIPQGHAQTINMLTQGFEAQQFPPVGGWSDSAYNPSTLPQGYPYWFRSTGNASFPGTVNILPPPQPPFSSHYEASAITVHPGSGSAFAWFNAHLVDSSTIGELATPPLNFSTLATIGGQYSLSFLYYNQPQLHDSNVMYVYLNPTAPNTTDPTAIKIDSIYPNAGTAPIGWIKKSYTLSQTYNSYTGAYIIFQAVDSFKNIVAPAPGPSPATQVDMALDDISIDFTPPCTGTPSGSINQIKPCNGVPFDLHYNDSVFTNLSYQWYSSTDSSATGWTAVGSNAPTVTITQTNDTMYYRVVVTCGISNTTDTIDIHAILNPYYLCYCHDTAGNAHTFNIGNVTMDTYPGLSVVLNNGNPNPIQNNGSAIHNYTDYTYLTPTLMFKDSTFGVYVTMISSGTFPSPPFARYASVYIDFDHSASFDPGEEVVVGAPITSVAGAQTGNIFHIPAGALPGITGMRVVLSKDSLDGPCGDISTDPYTDGETEDYLVNIVPDQCNSATDAGTAYISKTSECPGYTFVIGDSTHAANVFGIQYNWQSSPDNGVTWGNLPNVVNQDKLNIVYQNPESYRLQMVCLNSHDTTYSNMVSVGGEPSYACYCVSQSIGGVTNDTTDIGTFVLGNYTYTKSNGSNNGHLNNPSAINSRTDTYPGEWELDIDTTYNFLIYQIMRGNFNGDAKITLFIDFNNNLMYDYPDDLVLTLYTTPDSFFVGSSIMIQKLSYTVLNVPTGMRLIINSDTDANAASDQGCGSYTSGETLDFVVRLHDSTTLNVSRVQNLNNVAIFPNPTSGKFKVTFNAVNSVNHMDLSVTNVTGQQVMVKHYDNLGHAFATDIDMSGQAPGMYFVEFMVDGERMIKKLTVE